MQASRTHLISEARTEQLVAWEEKKRPTHSSADNPIVHTMHPQQRKNNRSPCCRAKKKKKIPSNSKECTVSRNNTTRRLEKQSCFKTWMVHLWSSQLHYAVNSRGDCAKICQETRAHFFFFTLLSLVCKCKNGRKRDKEVTATIFQDAAEGMEAVLFCLQEVSSMYSMYTTVAGLCIRKPENTKINCPQTWNREPERLRSRLE